MLSGEEIPELQALVRRVPVSDHCLDYAMAPGAGHAHRPSRDKPAYIDKWIAWGAGPRAGQALVLAAKARAALDGRTCVTIEDIRAVAQPVLRHRLVTTYAAQAEGQTPDSDRSTALLRDIPVRPGADAGRWPRRPSFPILKCWRGSPG